MKNKQLGVVILMVITVFLGGILYFLNRSMSGGPMNTQVNNPEVIKIYKNSDLNVDTSNWKTYTHPNLDFSIKYPDYLEPKYENEESIALINIDPARNRGPSIDGLAIKQVYLSTKTDIKTDVENTYDGHKFIPVQINNADGVCAADLDDNITGWCFLSNYDYSSPILELISETDNDGVSYEELLNVMKTIELQN